MYVDHKLHVEEAEFTLIWMDETQERDSLWKEYRKEVLLQLLGSEASPGSPDNLALATHTQQAN